MFQVLALGRLICTFFPPSHPVTSGNIPDLSSNTYLSLDGGYTLKCTANDIWTLAEAQAVGVDVGSSVGLAPSVDALVALGHSQLGF